MRINGLVDQVSVKKRADYYCIVGAGRSIFDEMSIVNVNVNLHQALRVLPYDSILKRRFHHLIKHYIDRSLFIKKGLFFNASGISCNNWVKGRFGMFRTR